MVQAIQVLRFHLLELEKVSVKMKISRKRLQRANNQPNMSTTYMVYGDGMRYLNDLSRATRKRIKNFTFKQFSSLFFAQSAINHFSHSSTRE